MSYKDDNIKNKLNGYVNTEDYWMCGQLEELEIWLKEGVNIRKYANPTYSSKALEQIRLGLREGLDISKYVNTELDGNQMEQIRLGLQRGVDVRVYSERVEHRVTYMRKDGSGEGEQSKVRYLSRVTEISYVRYNYRQMREIRLGLEKGLDVTKYKDIKNSWEEMREIRLGLENSKKNSKKE